MLGDPGRLRQILLNLLDNAVKFTDHGEVTLVVRGREQEERKVSLVFEVQDTGVGIPPGGAAQVFDSFTQLDDGPNRRQGGPGLGLAISRQLARLMGGEIELESQVGVGSIFRLRVRLARAAGDSAPAARAVALPATDRTAAPPPILRPRLGAGSRGRSGQSGGHGGVPDRLRTRSRTGRRRRSGARVPGALAL